MRILISGGGTGGHIYPALSVATQLQQQYQAEILYLGSDDGLETELAPKAGFRFASVKAGKLRRYLSWKTLVGVARVPLGMLEAVKIVRDFRPDVIFTSGGYVAVPAGLAAYLNGVPLVMHQQDVPPNLSNKLIGPLAKRISVAFADSLNYFPKQKTLHLGNPVREAILEVAGVPAEQARERLGFDPALPLVLVTGGSQGARHLNQVVCETLPELLMYCQVLQISGSKLFEETRSQAEQVLSGQNEVVKAHYRVVPYMDDEMALALQASSLVVCRAGAATLSELAVLGKPCLLVPLPPAIGGSPQEVNASMFARQQAAKVLKDGELTRPNLAKSIRSMLSSDEALRRMAEATLQLAKPHATEDIAAEVVRIAQRGRIKG